MKEKLRLSWLLAMGLVLLMFSSCSRRSYSGIEGVNLPVQSAESAPVSLNEASAESKPIPAPCTYHETRNDTLAAKAMAAAWMKNATAKEKRQLRLLQKLNPAAKNELVQKAVARTQSFTKAKSKARSMLDTLRLGIALLIIGVLVAIVFGIIPYLGWIAWIGGLIAVVGLVFLLLYVLESL